MFPSVFIYAVNKLLVTQILYHSLPLMQFYRSGKVSKRVACIYTSESDWGEEIIQGDELNVECSHMQRDCMTQWETGSVFYKLLAHMLQFQ